MIIQSILLLSLIHISAEEIIRCSAGLNCPSHQPCCSDLGFCGSDEITCKLSCVPDNSFNNSSCTSVSSCKNNQWDFTNSPPSKIQELAAFKANYKSGSSPKLDEIDFFTDGSTSVSQDGVTLKMLKGSKGGSRMVSSAYLLYGNISAVLKTGRTGGVVTSFITMSKVHDEIDFEWVGSEVESVQTNIYYRSEADHRLGGKSQITSDTSQNFHEYKMEWTPDFIKWYVDGSLIRTIEKKDTNKNGIISYPSTPSRIEFGLWNGGSNAEGTKNWAGGEVNWDSEDIQKKGYFDMIIKSLDITCHPDYIKFGDPEENPSGNNHPNGKSNDQSGNHATSLSVYNSWLIILLVLLLQL